MCRLRWIVCVLALGTAACSSSGKSTTADSSVPNESPYGGVSGTGGTAETGGTIATDGVPASGGVPATGGMNAMGGSGGLAASGGTSVDAQANEASATGGVSGTDAGDLGEASISVDGAAGESYVACDYVGGELFVAVMKETDDVCVLLTMATPIDGPKNLGLTLPGRWGLKTAALWPRSMQACAGSSAPTGSVRATSGSGTASFVVQGSDVIMDLDLVLQFPNGDASATSVPMKVKGLETSSKCT